MMSTTIITKKTLAAYRSYLRSDEKSPHTINKYLRDAETFRSFTHCKPITKCLTVDYKRSLIQSGKYEESTINSMITSLRGLLLFLGRDDCIVKNIRTQEMPFCPEDRSLEMEEYQRLLLAAGEDKRLQLILKVLFATGIRISELRYFTVEALRKTERNARVRVTCKKKSREILIPDELREELSDYIETQGITKGVIFRTRSGRPVDRSNVWKQMKRLCRTANVDDGKVFPHNIRKLFARTFYEKSHDIAQLACLLGHSSINTTTIYVRTTEQEVRGKVERMVSEVLYSGRSSENSFDNIYEKGLGKGREEQEKQNLNLRVHSLTNRVGNENGEQMYFDNRKPEQRNQWGRKEFPSEQLYVRT